MTGRSTRSPRRRTVVAMFVVLAVIGAFVIRLVDIQVVNAKEHIEQSLELGLSSSQETYGTRGAIVDENGATLAGSIVLYDAQLDPKLVGPIDREIDGEDVKVPWETISAEIGAVTGQSAEEIQAIVAAALAENPDSRYAMLTRGLTTAQYRELADMKTRRARTPTARSAVTSSALWGPMARRSLGWSPPRTDASPRPTARFGISAAVTASSSPGR